jgi:hypothetical protein
MDRKKLKELERKKENKKKHNLTRGITKPKYKEKVFEDGIMEKVKCD